MSRTHRHPWLVAPLLALPLMAARPVGEVAVDLELVLMVDASGSISDNTFAFQLQGHEAAFRNAGLFQAIDTGEEGRIAVTLVGFDNPNRLTTLVPWTLVATAGAAAAFADAIDAVGEPARGGSTAIGSALLAAARLFADNGYAATARTIDLSANGFSNAGYESIGARDRVVAQGITINALAILNEHPWLETYMAQEVIGGAGAFVRTADDEASFAEALLSKLVDEIAGRDGARALVAVQPD